MPQTDVRFLWEKVKNLKNVVGYAPNLVRKKVGGRERRSWAFRVYVSNKAVNPIEIRSLEKSGNMIPGEIDGIDTDVWPVSDLFGSEYVSDKELYFRKPKKKD